jgi:hypothetical protein
MAKSKVTKKPVRQKERPVGRTGAPVRAYSPSEGKALDIRYRIDGEPILYTDQFVVQFYPDEFVISFFQSAHPLIFSDEEFEKLETLDAKCIARFALNPPQMRRFFQALQHNLQRWGEAKEQERRELEVTK